MGCKPRSAVRGGRENRERPHFHQTVNESQNPRFYQLIREFKSLTGVPVLINTSFNDRGEPIIESPTDALSAFKRMNLDALVLGDYLILKK